MPVKQCILDGSAIQSLDDLYGRLASGLSLPSYFGCTLDALWDVLSADVEGPFEIVWKHANASKKAMGKDFDRIKKLLRDLEKERGDFKLKIEP